MPVDEERWPGPDAYEGVLLLRGIKKYLHHMYESYGKYNAPPTYDEWQEDQRKAKEEYIRIVEKERHEKELAKARDKHICMNTKPYFPSHVGPRNNNAFGRNGKKKF